MSELIKSVLLVDDDKPTSFYNKKVLSMRIGLEHIYAVQSGAEALQYLTETNNGIRLKPTIIFLDINMPAMNGWEFLKEYQKLKEEIKENTKIFILSTSSILLDIERAKRNRFVEDFINKPLSLGILDELLKKHFCFTI